MTPEDIQDRTDPTADPVRSAQSTGPGVPYARPSRLLIYPETTPVWKSATPIVAVAGGVLLLLAGIAAGSAWVAEGSAPDAVAVSTPPEAARPAPARRALTPTQRLGGLDDLGSAYNPSTGPASQLPPDPETGLGGLRSYVRTRRNGRRVVLGR